jgi:hypothetical protein
VPVVHVCNPTYSEGRDQEFMVQSQPRQIVWEPLSQKTIIKMGWRRGSRWRPWVQALVLQKKKKKARIIIREIQVNSGGCKGGCNASSMCFIVSNLTTWGGKNRDIFNRELYLHVLPAASCLRECCDLDVSSKVHVLETSSQCYRVERWDL